VVELAVAGSGDPGPDIQVLSERAGLPGSFTLDGQTVRDMLGLIQGARVDTDAYITDVSLAEDEDGLELEVVIGTEPRDGVPVEEVKRELYTRLTARPDTQVRIVLDQPPVRRILARQRDVDGFGWAPFAPAPLGHPVQVTETDGHGRGVAVRSGVTVANGAVTVVVDGDDGTFSIDGIRGYGQLVDSGDYGDTYNYSPPAVDSMVDRPDAVTVAVDERGPVRATVAITSTYTWPDRVDDTEGTRVGAHPVEVVTTLELRADDPVVRVHTRFVNPSRDHRVRVHLPLPRPSATSHAECAFTVVERGLTAEGRADEFGTPTFPSRRFVSSGGLTVVHEGLLEYELVDLESRAPGGPAAGTLALTVLRATGMLSRLGMSTRPLPAGPMTPLNGPQMLGPVDVRYALCVGDVDPYAMADDVLVPLMMTAAHGEGDRPGRGSALTVTGAEVSAVRRRAGQLEVRVFNPTTDDTRVELAGRSGWLVDLRGRPTAPFEGSFHLRAQGIATARLDGD
jgi:mannosylglycerate hydrolase